MAPPRKPDWLKVRFPKGPGYARIDRFHRRGGLHSVCRSAACPNQGECWSRGTATFMILGDRCTRDCRFCNVPHATPLPPDAGEAERVAAAIAELGLAHAVVTSVTRDDLPDGGAQAFAAVTRAIRARTPGCRIELLVPDFAGAPDALAMVLAARPDILGHNLETIARLTPVARSGADYRRSLALLEAAARHPQEPLVKSGLMLGLGESREEALEALVDLRQAGVRLVTLGQYLAPTRDHLPVARYLAPEEFAGLARAGREMGFDHVEAGPLVRSSYHAAEQLEGLHAAVLP